MAVAVWLAAARVDGLARVLDQQTRSYRVHLEVTENERNSISDYDLVLKRRPSSKADKESAKPATHFLFLLNLSFRSAEYSRKEAAFGSGTISFGADGLPNGVINPGWTLCPLLSFYVPGAEGRVLTDMPVAIQELGAGWSLAGTARMPLETLKGQAVDVEGKLTGKDGATMTLNSHATLDPKTGWPTEANGKISGPSASVTYTISLRS